MTETNTFLQSIDTALSQIDFHRRVAVECECSEETIELHNKALHIVQELKGIISSRNITANYINQFQNNIVNLLNCFLYRGQNDLNFIARNNKENIRISIEQKNQILTNQIKESAFNISFFQKLNFFNSNIVAIGANGSGKTTLSNVLKKYLPNTGVIISAQKVLIIPTFSGVSNFNNTTQKLQQSQNIDKTFKVTYSTEHGGSSYNVLNQLGGEFQLLLDNLLAERSVIRNQFCDALARGEHKAAVPETKLDKALSIWNYLIQHRVLECKDGINITLKTITNTTEYPAHQMSDGEKVILYFIAHVLQAPPSGFIIVDEPEMYLHKTILKKLWDTLEVTRPDCIFVYLTHDLDFAATRTTARKVWIKSFEHPDKWEIENIPDNELPETLLLELLGSRKNILFCEGKKGSIDEKIYNILFPNFTITPIESCLSVINYTKAFNRIPNITTKAFGLIDSDHHTPQRLRAIESDNIFAMAMTEPENLFLDEDFLKALSQQMLCPDPNTVVDGIKNDVIAELEKSIELQASNFISAKINLYFKDSDLSKGNTLATVKQNYEKFTQEVKIDEWHTARIALLRGLVDSKNYQQILALFNNKGLKAIANEHLKIRDFSDKAINLLQGKADTHLFLKRHFPSKIVENGSLS